MQQKHLRSEKVVVTVNRNECDGMQTLLHEGSTIHRPDLHALSLYLTT